MRRGEILGIAGLVGAGRSETMECIFGLTKRTGGQVWIEGNKVCFKSPTEAMKSGIGFVRKIEKMQDCFCNKMFGLIRQLRFYIRFLSFLDMIQKRKRYCE